MSAPSTALPGPAWCRPRQCPASIAHMRQGCGRLPMLCAPQDHDEEDYEAGDHDDEDYEAGGTWRNLPDLPAGETGGKVSADEGMSFLNPVEMEFMTGWNEIMYASLRRRNAVVGELAVDANYLPNPSMQPRDVISRVLQALMENDMPFPDHGCAVAIRFSSATSCASLGFRVYGSNNFILKQVQQCNFTSE
jgi:hypothetical protein